jgi:cystathionine beta-synthase
MEGAVTARKLARLEGMLMGYSAGSAVAGLHQLKDRLTSDDVVVIIFHDHGSRYVGKVYNDDWMRQRGFLDEEMTVGQVIKLKGKTDMLMVEHSDTIRHCFDLMKQHDISQMPVLKEGKIVGSITESEVLSFILENPLLHTEKTAGEMMGKPFPIVEENLAFKQLNKYISKKVPAVVVHDKAGQKHILTQYDIIQMI